MTAPTKGFVAGPWIESHSADYFPNGAQVIRYGSDCGPVVAVITLTPDWPAVKRLIAAAPDLLEALTKIAYMETESDQWDAVAKYGQCQNIARAALSNARGERT